MSSDLEQLAEQYARLGDYDLSLILRGSAQVSRRRQRPDHLLESALLEHEHTGITLAEIDAAMQASKDEDKTVDPVRYFQIQWDVLDIFTKALPKRERRYTAEEIRKGVETFRSDYGKNVPDAMLIDYFIFPGERSPTLPVEKAWELRRERDQIDLQFRIAWNRMVHALSRSVHPYASIGQFRKMEKEDLFTIFQFGPKSLELFRAAFAT